MKRYEKAIIYTRFCTIYRNLKPASCVPVSSESAAQVIMITLDLRVTHALSPKPKEGEGVTGMEISAGDGKRIRKRLPNDPRCFGI